MRGKLISIDIQRYRYLVVDLVTTAVAFFVFNQFRYILMDLSSYGYTVSDYLGSAKMITEQILIPISLLGVYWLSGYYNDPFGKSRLSEFTVTLFSAIINTLLIYLALLINDQLPTRYLSYELLLTLFGCLFLFNYTGRLILTQDAIRHFARREWCFNTILIGESENAIATAERLERTNTKLGYNIIGHLPIPEETASAKTHATISERNFANLCKTGQIDQLIIVPEPGRTDEKILNLLFRYFNTGVPIKIAPTSLSFLTAGIHINDIYAEPFIDITSPTMSNAQKNLKRVLDVMLSALAMIVLSPVYAFIALAVRLDSSGPVIYRQQRIGYRQKPFNIYKFRSMKVDAENAGPQLSDDNDPRITKVGKFLRKYRLDEIPQFWNVFIGDMSLVGPRPEREFFIKQIVEKVPFYTLVHQVKPGITSWGMVKFGYARSVDEMVERSQYDLVYLSNMSVAVDFKIMIHTVKTVVLGKGM